VEVYLQQEHGWLPTWLTVTEAPTVAVCLTCNIVHMTEKLKVKITTKVGRMKSTSSRFSAKNIDLQAQIQ
jgi:hypothetical protein